MIAQLCTRCHGIASLILRCDAEVLVDASMQWCSCHSIVVTQKIRRFVWYALTHHDAPYGSEENMPIEAVLFSNGHVATSIDDWKSTKYFYSFSAFVKNYVPQHIEWLDEVKE